MAAKPIATTTKPAAEKPTEYPKDFLFDAGTKKIKIRMTFGLLTELCQGFQTMEDFQIALTDQDTLFDLINTCIAARDAEGQIDEENSDKITRLDPELEEFERLSTWILGHVLSFFVKRTKAFTSVTLASQGELQALVERLNKLKIGSQG